MEEYTSKISIHPSKESAAQAVLYNEEKTSGPVVISFLNAHSVNLAQRNQDFKNALLSSDFLFRDGIGVKLLLKAFNMPCGENLNGTDFIPYFLKSVSDKKTVLIGTTQVYVLKCKRNLEKNGVNIIQAIDGFRDFETLLSFIEQHRPDVVLLGMGMPKQELFSQYLKSKYDHYILVVNGGAIIDFIAGRFPRAPRFVRLLNLEWLYRLIKEPFRLFKRYVIGNPLFLIRVFNARFIKNQSK